MRVHDRAKSETIRDEGLEYLRHQVAAIKDVEAVRRGRHLTVDVQYRYLVLNAATAALDHDDRERDAVRRDGEVFATLVVAAVAAVSTFVQAIARSRNHFRSGRLKE